MSSEFDPYRIWLSIPPSEQPANYYRLLGLPLFESDPDVIRGAADRQMTHVRSFQTGKHSDLSQKILNELSVARITLLDPVKKSKYDSELRAKLNTSKKSDSNYNHSVLPPRPQQTPAFEIKAPPVLPKKIQEVPSKPVPVQGKKQRKPSQKESRTNKAGRHPVPVQRNRILLFSGIAVILLILLTIFLTLLFGLSSQIASENKEPLENESNDNLAENSNQDSQDVVVNETVEKKAGDRMVKVVDGVEFAFRWCPAGTFMMGSPEDESGRSSSEKQHQVTLTKGFWILETEVTVGMFKAFVKETGYESKGGTPSLWNGYSMKYFPECSWEKTDFYQDDNYPVTCISWGDALEFNKWLGSKIGQDVDLPTEAQWEYACRAGTTGAYNGIPDEVAWRGTNADNKTHPVAKKQANDWGIYDMHGNVLEWCLDNSSPYPSESVTDPVVNNSGTMRAIRGGSFIDVKGRSAFRNWTISAGRGIDLGFRCVIVSDDKAPSPKAKTAVGTKAGDKMVKVVNGAEFAFRWCPPGTFRMGSMESEIGRKSDEKQHKVTLSKGFWMMETEVTQKQWQAIMNSNPSHFQGDDLPVEKVSWEDCQEFCKKCKEQFGFNVQLPTEAQWEYACRAGTTDAFAGDLNQIGWYLSNSDNKKQPVGKKKPNAWGLFDMHGNVWEWCQNYNYSYSTESVTDPTGPDYGWDCAIRGGCWFNDAGSCRSAMRFSYRKGNKYSNVGFRCIIKE